MASSKFCLTLSSYIGYALAISWELSISVSHVCLLEVKAYLPLSNLNTADTYSLSTLCCWMWDHPSKVLRVIHTHCRSLMEANGVNKRATRSIHCGKNSFIRAAAGVVLMTLSFLHSHQHWCGEWHQGRWSEDFQGPILWHLYGLQSLVYGSFMLSGSLWATKHLFEISFSNIISA